MKLVQQATASDNNRTGGSATLDTISPIVGDYENHTYDGTPNKNDWHYVTISKVNDTTLKWTNRAGASWTLTTTDDKRKLAVGNDCPYFASGHTQVTVFWEGNRVTGLTGPGDDLYASNREIGRSALRLIGDYENHTYDGTPNKNDWHYVTINKVNDTTLKWSNRAGVSWTMTMLPDKTKLAVGEDCPYYASGYTEATVVWDGDNVTGIITGPNGEGELYSLVPTSVGLHIMPTAKPEEIQDIRSQAENLATVKNTLGVALTPPTPPVPQVPMATLISQGDMPQYQLYLRLKNAIQNNQLELTQGLLGDFGGIGAIADEVLDIFVSVNNPKVTFSAGTGGMVGAPGREIQDPANDTNLSAPDDNAVKLKGDATILGISGAQLDTADFFIYKGKPNCSFKVKLGDEIPLGTLIPSVSILPNLKLTGPTMIVCTASTLYDQGLDSGINEGINFFGNVKLKDSGDRMLEFLGDFLMTKEIAIHSAIDTSSTPSSFVLEAAVQRDVTLLNGAGIKIRYTRSDIALEVKGRPPEPSLTGSSDLVVTLDHNSDLTHLIFTGGIKGEAESITGFFYHERHGPWCGWQPQRQLAKYHRMARTVWYSRHRYSPNGGPVGLFLYNPHRQRGDSWQHEDWRCGWQHLLLGR